MGGGGGPGNISNCLLLLHIWILKNEVGKKKKGRKTHKSQTCPQGTYPLRADICTSSPGNIWDVASSIQSLLLLLLLTSSVLARTLSPSQRVTSAFSYVQKLLACLGGSPSLFVLKKSKHTVSITATKYSDMGSNARLIERCYSLLFFRYGMHTK